nr:hypothetical protein [Rhodoferax sp.]
MYKWIALVLLMQLQNSACATVRVEKNILYITDGVGGVGIDDAKKITEDQAFQSVDRVIISSGGGRMLAAIIIANWIHDKKLDVEIQKFCVSSCANYIFPAGRKKTIADGALLIWHGGAFQSNFVTTVNGYEKSFVAQELSSYPDKNTFFASKDSTHYQNLKIEQSLETSFYRKIGVNPGLPTVGQRAGANLPPWTLSIEDMEKLFITDIQYPVGYGTDEYLKKWLARTNAPTPVRLLKNWVNE